jgi:hypothetical protein
VDEPQEIAEQEIAKKPGPTSEPQEVAEKPEPTSEQRDIARQPEPEGPRDIAQQPEPKPGPQVSKAAGWTRMGRTPLIFAAVGVLIALVTGGVYVYKQAVSPPPRTPEQAINEFLTAVFVARDATRVSAVVCASWDPVNALERTVKEVQAEATVSWDEVRILSSTEDRVNARARLGFRLRDDNQPSVFRQWRFSLVKEKDWRVCEARPFVV